MKLVYISDSNIPSRTANSIHVMKMCQAFAKNGHRVILLLPEQRSRYEHGVDDIFDYYGVEKCFIIKKIFCPIIKIKVLFYSIGVILKLAQIKPDLVYGRSFPGCIIASLVGYKTIFESHSPILEESIIKGFFFRLLISRKSLIKIIVISDALKYR